MKGAVVDQNTSPDSLQQPRIPHAYHVRSSGRVLRYIAPRRILQNSRGWDASPLGRTPSCLSLVRLKDADVLTHHLLLFLHYNPPLCVRSRSDASLICNAIFSEVWLGVAKQKHHEYGTDGGCWFTWFIKMRLVIFSFRPPFLCLWRIDALLKCTANCFEVGWGSCNVHHA